METRSVNYNATATNANACYSTLDEYKFTCNSVVSPQPASVVPQIFCKYKPHPMPQYCQHQTNQPTCTKSKSPYTNGWPSTTNFQAGW